MKKVIFVNFWSTGGMRHYSDSLAKLIGKKYDVHYFNNYTSGIGKESHFYLTNNPLNFKNYVLLWKILKKIRKINPQAVHINGSSCVPWLFIYPFIRKNNPVFTLHDAVPHEGERLLKRMYQKFHFRVVSRFVKKITVHSEKIKLELPLFFRNNQILILPHVNISVFPKTNFSKKTNKCQFTLLFFGRILDYKGLNYLVEAFNQLPENKYKLIIAGEGKINCEIPKRKEISVINRFVSDEEMASLFNEADAVVLPYTSASQSGIIFAAFSFNKPVIATNVGAIPEAVKNNVNGVLIKPKSSSEIVRAIKKIENKSFYIRLVQNIRHQNESEDRQILKKLEEIYEN